MKKKVLIIASWYPSEISQVEGIFIQDQAVVLSSHYDVAVLAPKIVGWRRTIKRWINKGPMNEQDMGLTVNRPRTLLPIPYLSGPLRYYLYLKMVRKGFEKLLTQWGRPDIIHAHVVLPGGWAGVRLARRHSIPVVLTEHSGPLSIHLKTLYQRRLVEDTFIRASCVIAVSPALAREINSISKGVRLKVIGNLIKTKFFSPLEHKEEKGRGGPIRFLTISLMTWQKGLPYLLRAGRSILQAGTVSFEIILGGDGPDRSKLEEMSKRLGVSDRCHFIGLLRPDQVKAWIQKCDVFILPSLHESFGIVLGEAMAMGKPVIATRCGGPEFIVTPDTGILVAPGDTKELAEAMEGFITGRFQFNPQVIRKSIEGRFGEEVFLHKISSLYEEIWSQKQL